MSSLVAECTFRPLEPSEVGLLLDSWAKSFRSSDYAGVIPNHLYFGVVKQLVGGLIARGAKVTAAVIGDRVLGWVCYETKASGETALHYVYVKDAFRRQGLGRALVDRFKTDRVFYTHKTRYAKYVLPKGAVFVPEIARRKDF